MCVFDLTFQLCALMSLRLIKIQMSLHSVYLLKHSHFSSLQNWSPSNKPSFSFLLSGSKIEINSICSTFYMNLSHSYTCHRAWKDVNCLTVSWNTHVWKYLHSLLLQLYLKTSLFLQSPALIFIPGCGPLQLDVIQNIYCSVFSICCSVYKFLTSVCEVGHAVFSFLQLCIYTEGSAHSMSCPLYQACQVIKERTQAVKDVLPWANTCLWYTKQQMIFLY